MRCLVFIFLLAGIFPARADSDPAPLRVGVAERPPLVIRGVDGEWTGISVDLWKEVSAKMGVKYELVEMPLDRLIDELHQGKIDLALGEVSVSADRERLVDFTQPYLTSGAAVVQPRKSTLNRLADVLKGMLGDGLLLFLLSMGVILAIFSLLLWLAERRMLQSNFGGPAAKGFGSALWFSAVTMTTVGYGDKTPRTALGRMLAFVWMMLGILLVSAFTGSVASGITLDGINSSIAHLRDLDRFRNGVLNGSLASEVLRNSGIPAEDFATEEVALDAIENGRINALVGDRVSLSYALKQRGSNSLSLAGLPSMHMVFAVVTRPKFPQMEALNVAILEVVDSPGWNDRITFWIGRGPVGR